MLDGEHILHNKKQEFINLYAAFDVYFIKGVDVRAEGFIPVEGGSGEKDILKYRLPKLIKVIKSLDPVSIVKGKVSPIRITHKNFYDTNQKKSIFTGCNLILDNIENGKFEYNTDGLIFTPMDMGVGMNKVGEAPKQRKTTWEHSFKWKPVEFNTIDFLITTQKNPLGQEYIGNIFQDGKNNLASEQITQYKTLILRVGFNEDQHGYINPCADVLNENYPSHDSRKGNYKPVPFYPTDPSDPDAHICNILLSDDGLDSKKMITEEGEIIEDNMIVEFRYDVTKDNKWRWIPLRVRYDKTAEYRSGLNNFGNAYHVANNNWRSIHNPITNHMIRTGDDIPDELGDDDVYYNKLTGTTNTRSLRDFHNLFVKNFLLTRVSHPGDTLIDYAVGKGGDLPKWIAAKLSLVFGIDISKDNIENRLDGICSRYLNYHKKNKIIPAGIFLHGNSSLNIRNTEALYSEKAKQIARAIFGEGPKDDAILGKAVVKQYGKGAEGFNVSSIQFALHYMFESASTLQNYLCNVSECTKKNGYFIATCYDGKVMFDKLSKKNLGDSITIMDDDKKMWSVTKQYNRDTYEADESCVGYPIDVYQESINKTFREYLVNFDYLNRLMENYGFQLLKNNELRDKGIPSSSGMFNELFNKMKEEVKRDPRKKADYKQALEMSTKEKQVSFLNRFIIYKKVRDVDAKAVRDSMIDTSEVAVEETKEAQEVVAEAEEKVKESKPKKIKGKVKLNMKKEKKEKK